MIVDRIENTGLYQGLGGRLTRALQFVRETDLAALPLGKHEIDGKDLFVSVQEYESRLPEKAVWEAHRKYIDLQVVVSGEERIGHAHLDRLTAGTYDEAKDFLPLQGAGDWVAMTPGSFMILWPHDAHAPCVARQAPVKVRKVVVKIRV